MEPAPSVTEQVRSMYDEVSYTAYGEDYFPVVKSLGLGRKEFAALAQGNKALEIGCGGGQLSVFLSQHFNSVTGVDISPNSLATARSKAAERNITNLEFLEGNLFDDDFLARHARLYDFVLCYGVLHHTENPEEGFARLAQLVKPGGMLVVGVYSRTQLRYRFKRQVVIWLAGNNPKKRFEIANNLFFRGRGREVALYDGYVHPQVSFHSIAEVYGWIERNHLQYSGAWPPITLGSYFDLMKSGGKAAKTRSVFGSKMLRRFIFLLVELAWIISGKSVMVSVASRKIAG